MAMGWRNGGWGRERERVDDVSCKSSKIVKSGDTLTGTRIRRRTRRRNIGHR